MDAWKTLLYNNDARRTKTFQKKKFLKTESFVSVYNSHKLDFSQKFER